MPNHWSPDVVFYSPGLLMGGHGMSLVTRWFAASATFFHNHLNLKVSRASCCSSKHSPDATACLNHTAIHKCDVHERAQFKHEKYLDLLVAVKSFVLRQSSSYLITSYVISSHLINNLKIFLDLFEKNQSITLF